MLRSMRAAYAPYIIFLLVAAILFFLSSLADARGVRGGTAQSVHAGGARAGGGGGGHDMNRSAGANRNIANNNNANRNINNNTNRDINRDRDVNRNVNRDVDRHVDRDIDIDVDVDNGWDGHPIARGVAFGTAAAVTAAAIGSVIYTLPPSCPMRPYGALTYYYCGGVWYEPRYSGSSVTYIIVQQPY